MTLNAGFAADLLAAGVPAAQIPAWTTLTPLPPRPKGAPGTPGASSWVLGFRYFGSGFPGAGIGVMQVQFHKNGAPTFCAEYNDVPAATAALFAANASKGQSVHQIFYHGWPYKSI